MKPTKQHNVEQIKIDNNLKQLFIYYTDGSVVEYQFKQEAIDLGFCAYSLFYREKNIEGFKEYMQKFEKKLKQAG